MKPRLPIAYARCDTLARCPQSSRCARYLAIDDDLDAEVIDPGTPPKCGCSLFIDQRGIALLQQPAPRRDMDALRQDAAQREGIAA